MKNTILILISLLFLTGCEKEVTSLQDRGGVKYEVNSETSFTGRLVKKYENGQKTVEEHYKDGKLDGLYTYWYKNGQKMFEVVFKNEMYEGLFTYWYKNGQKKEEGKYKNGMKEGVWTEWYENGQKEWEGNYKNGRLVNGKLVK